MDIEFSEQAQKDLEAMPEDMAAALISLLQYEIGDEYRLSSDLIATPFYEGESFINKKLQEWGKLIKRATLFEIKPVKGKRQERKVKTLGKQIERKPSMPYRAFVIFERRDQTCVMKVISIVKKTKNESEYDPFSAIGEKVKKGLDEYGIRYTTH
jgi:hypothetical protein